MHVAVSGASGFLGTHLCRELAARGHRVTALERAQLQAGDCSGALAGADSIVHLAARAHVLSESCADPRAEFHRANVLLTQQLASAAQRAGVRRFIFVSSAGVLGACSPPGGFSEDAVPRPHDAYTASKLEAELWLQRQLSSAMELAILRPPLIYGAGARGNFMRLLRLAARGVPLPVGALRAPRSLVGVGNVVDLILTLAAASSVNRVTMLVADSEITCVADLYQTVAREAGHRLWLAPLPPALIRFVLGLSGRSEDVVRLTGSFVLQPQIARARFGWVPPHTQQDQLRRAVASEIEARLR